MKIKIRKATYDDVEFLFNLANDSITRQNSFNSAPIKWHEHTTWLKDNLNNPSRYIYIFESNNKKIGTVNLKKDTEVIISVTVSPEFRGLGIASQIIKIGCSCFWKDNDDDICAYIKTENVASLMTFKKAGFVFCSDSVIGNINFLIFKAKKNVHK